MEESKYAVRVNMIHLLLMWAIIRSAEIKPGPATALHKSLREKVDNARYMKPGGALIPVYLTQDEKKLLRQYNTDYCAVLADKPDTGETVGIYQMATRIQMLFSKNS
ncbi:hypothetical protein [Dyadobacter sp.]|uniref:hypothetical protein n=1 Tax=Dyadobacter sp. TaxID=1914288 RepID=UPI003F711BAA